MRLRHVQRRSCANTCSQRGRGSTPSRVCIPSSWNTPAATASLAEAQLEVGGAAEVVRIVDAALPAYADVGGTRHEERLRRARDAARDELARDELGRMR